MPLFYEYYLLIILKIQLIPFEIKPKTLIIMKLIPVCPRRQKRLAPAPKTYRTKLRPFFDEHLRIISGSNGFQIKCVPIVLR